MAAKKAKKAAARPRGRPARAGKAATRIWRMRLTESELAELERRAWAAGYDGDISAYVRAMCLG